MLGSVNPTPEVNVEKEIPNEPEISIEDFLKVDLRVATVLACEAIPKADKLLKLQVRPWV